MGRSSPRVRRRRSAPTRRSSRPISAAARRRRDVALLQLGVCQSPEGRRVFARMTVHENLEMGAFSRKEKTKIASDFERVYGLFPRLKERTAQRAGTLSGGEQQMLAIARA